jgi:hypothetical protein
MAQVTDGLMGYWSRAHRAASLLGLDGAGRELDRKGLTARDPDEDVGDAMRVANILPSPDHNAVGAASDPASRLDHHQEEATAEALAV